MTNRTHLHFNRHSLGREDLGAGLTVTGLTAAPSEHWSGLPQSGRASRKRPIAGQPLLADVSPRRCISSVETSPTRA